MDGPSHYREAEIALAAAAATQGEELHYTATEALLDALAHAALALAAATALSMHQTMPVNDSDDWVATAGRAADKQVTP
jgi:hypothetical protein